MNDNFVMQPGGVPAGAYPLAEFVGAEDINNQFGPAVKLKWRILGGQHDGQEATRIAAPWLTPGSALGKLAVALKGGPIAVGENFSFSQYVGTRGSLVVEPTQGGGGRVSMFVRQVAVTTPQAETPWQTYSGQQAAPVPPPALLQVTPEQFAAWEAFRRQQASQQ